MIFPFPDRIYKDVTKITPSELKKMGIKGLLLDIDGTLARTKDPGLTKAVEGWIGSMKEHGIKLFVLSNNKSPARTESFAKKIGCAWRHRSRKPSRKGFFKAAEELELRPSEIAIVGDQIFTDVLGGLRSGMKTLMVGSKDTYLWYFPFRRLLELPFRFERRRK